MTIKRIKCFLLSLLFAFTFIPKNVIKFTASADTLVQTGYETFMESYFDFLMQNYGENYQGSCTQVALGMLLSYYDTFHDDLIIPDQYEAVTAIDSTANNDSNINRLYGSPGIKKDLLEPINGVEPDEFSASQYFTLMSQMSNEFFHAYLITLIESFGWYNYSANEDFCGLTMEQTITLLNYYLTQKNLENEEINYSNYTNYTANDYTITSINRNSPFGENVKEYAINKIKQGLPVVLVVAEAVEEQSIDLEQVINGESVHAVIAYDYKSDETDVYCHYGNNPYLTHVSPVSRGDNIYLSAFCLEWNTPHNCSNNYVVKTQDVNGNEVIKTYCYEHKDIITYDHVCSNSIHNYGIETYAITSSSAKYYHKAICHCENVINQSHTVNASGFCTVCSQHVNHNFTYNYKDNNTHVINCSTQNCFYAKTAPHVFDASNLTYCILCKHIVLGGGIGNVGGVFSIELAPLVSANGSYVLSNGCVVLVEEDKEAYFNDTLQFYPRGEVPQIS